MSNMNKPTDTVIILNNVRLSFPALFQPKTGPEAGSKPAYSAVFILDKKTNAKDIEAIKAGMTKIAAESFKGKIPPKNCLHDGSEKPELDGYGDGVMYVSARSEKRQPVVDNRKIAMSEDDPRMYAGCYVNAVVRLWAQDNKYGKRVNASLGPVQYVRPGKPFGGTFIDPDTAFTELPDSEEAVV